MSAWGDLEGIQFGVLTDEQIRSLAVVEVTESTLHTKSQPKANGPIDTRFGTCSRFQLCGTCKNSVQNCPGHAGFISLPYPLPHVAFIKYLTQFMNVFCFNCSHFLLPPESIPTTARTAKNRLMFAFEEARKARGRKRTPLMCRNPECGVPQPTVYVEEPFIKLAWRDDVVQHFYNLEPDASLPAPVLSAKAQKKRKKVEEEEAAKPAETPEQQVLREQLQADYEYFVKRPFTNWDAYRVLQSIRKSDLAILGIDGEKTHPSGFMLMSIIVPPMGVRPTVSFEEGSKRCGYNQLTKKISEIVKMKRSLLIEAADCKVRLDAEQVGELPDSVKTAIQMLYVTIAHYMIKDKCKVPGLKMSPYAARAHARAQSVSAALNGKKGRYRDTLMGKRVDFCLRTVVTTDPDADLDEIGLPEELAKRLTIPIRVNRHNREALQTLMSRNGVLQIVDEQSGDMIAVSEHNRDTLALMDGWVVERFVRDGDWIPINRQPTLHRPSIMGHRVRIHKHRTLQLPAPCTIPYNADHDGDEMNGHIPQTPEARAEVQELMAVSRHIMHPRANKPVMGIIQDGIDGAYFMTHVDTFLTRGEVMQLLMTIRYSRDADINASLGEPGTELHHIALPVPAILKPSPRWTGKQVISQVIPRLNMRRALKNRSKGYDDPHMASDGTLLVANGELLMGTLCKQTLGDSAGGIIHMACLYLSNNAAARFISDVQRMINKFLITVGFSVGVKDCLTDPAVHQKVKRVLSAAEAHIAHIRALADEMAFDPQIRELAETQISNTLKCLTSMVGNVVRANLTEANMFNIMANVCGSKGSSFNLAQIMGFVGQTFVNGLRPVARGNGRVLPNAPLPGQAPLSIHEQLKTQGLIDRPYKAGLSMPAAFLHNMGGREGLVDTAAKTSRTGYLQRRTVKAMESHHVAYDNTVRDAYQNVFQLCFGTDGLDTTRLTKVTLTSLLLDNAALRHRCIADDAYCTDDKVHQQAMVDEWTELLRLRDELRRVKLTNFQRNLSQNLDVYLPFHVATLLEVQQMQCHGKHTRGPFDPVHATAAVRQLCDTIESEVPSMFTCYHVRDEMSTGRLASAWQLCAGCVDAVCVRILKMHRDGRLQAGEGIGAMTATSIGEPCTQMSAVYDTMVLVRQGVDGVPQLCAIGELIDRVLPPRDEQSHVVVPPVRWQCVGVSPVEETKWVDITHFSRHPANGGLVAVRTANGRTLEMTLSHSFLVRRNNRVVPLPGSALVVGDAIPVIKRMPEGRRMGGFLTLWHYLVADLIVLQEKMQEVLQAMFVVRERRLELDTRATHMSSFVTMALARFGVPVRYVTKTTLQIPPSSVVRFLRRWMLVPMHAVDTAVDMTVVPGMAELLAASEWPRGAPAIMAHLADFYEMGVRTNADPWLMSEIHQALMADVFWDTIERLTRRDAEPGELVYDFTVQAECQSFMLGNGAFVHNTLNSVSWETPVRLFFAPTAETNNTVTHRVVPMGKFIDAEMEARPKDVVRQDDGCEWIPLTKPTKVLSVDLDGQWSYETVEAVSRHPVRNPDGTEAVLQVTTLSGRTVIATYGESFLRYAPVTATNATMERLEVTKGSELRIGDFLPVTFLHSTVSKAHPPERDATHDDGPMVYARLTSKWTATGLLHGHTKPSEASYTLRGDPIVALKRLPAPPVGANGRKGCMYDLTVANTKNFVLANGLAVRDTFHQAGAAKAGMTYGVPRMREIICGSKNISTPCMTLPLKRPFAHIKEAAENLARALPFTLLRNILASTDTVYEPDIMTSHLATDVALVEQHAPFMAFIRERCCRWVVRFELCKMRSGARSLEPRGIADLIQEELADGALVIASRVSDEHWIIRVYLVDVESTVDHALKRSMETTTNTRGAPKRASQRPSITSRKRRKFADLSQIPNIGGTSESVASIPVPLHRIDPAVGKTVHTARDVIEWMLVRNTQQDLKNTLRVCGVPDITGATVRLSERTDIDAISGAVRVVDEWVVDVHGSNFMQLAMLHPVDMGHIMSNHVMVIYDTLGVDAAAHVLFQELQACLNASGSRVDDRLIKLLVDVMTHHGFIMPISRHGLNRLVEHGVLAKITFEETLEMLFEAAALGHFDPLLGVSENVMVGRQPSLGTNLSKMYMERDGHRLPCQRTAQDATTTMPDTRVITSVVTEHDDDDLMVTDDVLDPADASVNWERILTTRHTDHVQAAVAMTGTLVSDTTRLYEHQFYARQTAPIIDDTPDLPPFRPGSPTFFMDDLGGSMLAVEPFRPASPDFDF